MDAFYWVTVYNKYSAILQLFCFRQLITNFTRVTDKSTTIINHILCNSNSTNIRSLKKHNASLYISHLSNINWNELVSSHHDVNMAWCRFKKTLISILDKVAPIKEVRLKQRAKPWMNSEILNDIRERDNLLHNFNKKPQ